MKKWLEVIIAGVASSIIGILVTLIIGYFTLPSGMVFINNPIHLNQDNFFVTIDIVNYSDKVLRDLIIEVPGKVNKIYTSKMLDYTIEKYNTSNTLEYIKIGRFSEKIHNQIVIEYQSTIDTPILVSNIKKNNMKLSDYTKYMNPIRARLFDAIMMGTIYGIFTALSTYYAIRRFDNRKEVFDRKIEKVNNDLEINKRELELHRADVDRETKIREELDVKLKDIEKKLENVNNKAQKYRLLYVSRISEYRKELDFWRDTFRKVVVNKSDSEYVINEITSTLKTYGTLYSDSVNLDYISIAGSIIKDQD